MSAPNRHYHNLDHIAEMWRRHRRMARGPLRTAGMRRRVASAIAFHDAIYHPLSSDNEAASAALWRRFARQSGLPRDLIRQVATAIEATACHCDATVGAACDPWVRWFLDLDLVPIAASPNDVAANASRLRAEQPHLSAAAWRQRTRRFYAELQQRPRIFHSPDMIAAFESRARRHLEQGERRIEGA
jgi:predicted metal-dependent HD superfamily phosphohydrolase